MPANDAELPRLPFQVPAPNATPRLGQCLRAARGLTLREASLRSGLAMSTLSRVENGQMSLTYDKLLQISGGLQISIAELFASPTGTRAASDRAPQRQPCGPGQRVHTPMYDYLYQFTDMKQKLMVPIMALLTARSMAEFGDFIRHGGGVFLGAEGPGGGAH